MKMSKPSLFSVVVLQILVVSIAFGEPDPQIQKDREAVNEACKAEGATAGCGSSEVGTGLLKCIGKYRKEHKKDFKISDGCKAAMKKLREDRKNKDKKK